MNNQLSKLKSVKREEGFTIIEVLIVLAIGALIILAVLIAVPALQQNQRNSSRKSEAARVSTAVTNLLADNNSATLTSTDNGGLAGRAGLNATSGQLKTVSVNTSAATANTSTSVAYVVNTATCSGQTYTIVATDTTKYVVFYNLDGGGSACIQVQ